MVEVVDRILWRRPHIRQQANSPTVTIFTGGGIRRIRIVVVRQAEADLFYVIPALSFNRAIITTSHCNGSGDDHRASEKNQKKCSRSFRDVSSFCAGTEILCQNADLTRQPQRQPAGWCGGNTVTSCLHVPGHCTRVRGQLCRCTASPE